METIKKIFKIGYGPSSSHTMAPARAADIFKKYLNSKNNYIIDAIFYNSLNKTGNGHLTYSVIESIFKPLKVNIIRKIDKNLHPNFFTFIAKNTNSDEVIKKDFISIGGGDLNISDDKNDIYPLRYFSDIKKYCIENNITLYDYVYKYENKDIKDYLENVYNTMKDAINRGLGKDGILPGKLKTKRKAKLLYENKKINEAPEVAETRLISAYAYAVSEENASGGIIVTAPTCGACGVLPAVLYYMENKYTFIKKNRIINALAVAGLVGNIIKENASISGAVAGCQAEIGSATAMAAAAHATLFNLSIEQVEYAAEIAMEHQLGLTCDPIMGYVQIPCIERNAVASLRAINSCSLAFFLPNTRKVSFDTVVKTMYQTGKDLKKKYRETSDGGLAKFYDK